MNELEKKSFYSFLFLYLSSSLLFILLLGYWYFNAQEESINSTIYYKMAHISDKVSSQIIDAQMHNKTLNLMEIKDGYKNSKTCCYDNVTLIHTNKAKGYKEGYFEKDGFKILVSASPREHLNIKYVIVKTDEYFKQIKELKKNVLLVMIFSFMFIVIISFVLSKFFMKPINTRMKQIESFIQDVSHELNTPITALGMSSQRAIKKGVFDKKILTNILISTKQLESIYKSLAYLNFNKKDENIQTIELKPILERVVRYYEEISKAKCIKITQNFESSKLKIAELKAELLFSNLLSNAIKYSMPDTTISLELKEKYFSIKDEGVGIPKDKLLEVFELYKRESSIAGGFGVGLNIVKQICDEYGIRVEVNSQLGIGSEFKLYLS